MTKNEDLVKGVLVSLLIKEREELAAEIKQTGEEINSLTCDSSFWKALNESGEHLLLLEEKITTLIHNISEDDGDIDKWGVCSACGKVRRMMSKGVKSGKRYYSKNCYECGPRKNSLNLEVVKSKCLTKEKKEEEKRRKLERDNAVIEEKLRKRKERAMAKSEERAKAAEEERFANEERKKERERISNQTKSEDEERRDYRLREKVEMFKLVETFKQKTAKKWR